MIKLLKTAGVVILLSCFYWGPMLEQSLSGKFGFNEPWAAAIGIMPISLNRIFDSSYYASIGLPVILLTVIRIFITKQSRKNLTVRGTALFKLSDKFLFICLILVFLATYIFPWSLFNDTPLNYIQFPWK
jgi:hypothetical protein